MATSIMPFLATPQHSELVSCRSGELAVRWTQATYLSTCVRPELRGECSGRFGTSWSFAGHCVHGKILPHLSLSRKMALNARRIKLEYAGNLDRTAFQCIAKNGTRPLSRRSPCCQIGVCHFGKTRSFDARVSAGSCPAN